MSDLISRQAAIDAVDVSNLHRGIVSALQEIIRELPSVQPQSKREWYQKGYEAGQKSVQPQRWIPVTEALPNDGVEVWVTIKGHDVIRCEEGKTLEQAIDRINKIRWVTRGYWSDEEHAWNDPSFAFPLMVQPIAWMPINTPDPWRGGQDETN